ncbi:hypothetical protein HK405_000645, partial [Cladochytrium tenue]
FTALQEVVDTSVAAAIAPQPPINTTALCSACGIKILAGSAALLAAKSASASSVTASAAAAATAEASAVAAFYCGDLATSAVSSLLPALPQVPTTPITDSVAITATCEAFATRLTLAAGACSQTAVLAAATAYDLSSATAASNADLRTACVRWRVCFAARANGWDTVAAGAAANCSDGSQAYKTQIDWVAALWAGVCGVADGPAVPGNA